MAEIIRTLDHNPKRPGTVRWVRYNCFMQYNGRPVTELIKNVDKAVDKALADAKKEGIEISKPATVKKLREKSTWVRQDFSKHKRGNENMQKMLKLEGTPEKAETKGKKQTATKTTKKTGGTAQKEATAS